MYLIQLPHIANPLPDLEKGRLGVTMQFAVLERVQIVVLPLLEWFVVRGPFCGPHTLGFKFSTFAFYICNILFIGVFKPCHI